VRISVVKSVSGGDGSSASCCTIVSSRRAKDVAFVQSSARRAAFAAQVKGFARTFAAYRYAIIKSAPGGQLSPGSGFTRPPHCSWTNEVEQMAQHPERENDCLIIYFERLLGHLKNGLTSPDFQAFHNESNATSS